MKHRRIIPALIIASFGLGLAYALWDAAHGMDTLADVVARRWTGQET